MHHSTPTTLPAWLNDRSIAALSFLRLGGSVAGAARIAGLTPRDLRAILKRYVPPVGLTQATVANIVLDIVRVAPTPASELANYVHSFARPRLQ